MRPKITYAAVNTTNVTQSRLRRSPDGATKPDIKPITLTLTLRIQKLRLTNGTPEIDQKARNKSNFSGRVCGACPGGPKKFSGVLSC